MKKMILIILICISFVACKDIKEFPNITPMDEVVSIHVEKVPKVGDFEPSKEWLNFTKTLNDLSFTPISKSDLDDLLPDHYAYYVVTLHTDSRPYVYYISDDLVATYHDENQNGVIDSTEYYYSDDTDIKELLSVVTTKTLATEINEPEKPVIYIYPIQTMAVSVKVLIEGRITTSYPLYNDGWMITVEPGGKITSNHRSYDYLYWEGEIDRHLSIEEGFVVSGANTVMFLEEQLTLLGLNYREQNDFITYWLPRMEKNVYNKIKFLTDEYDTIAELQVEPAPESLIRVFMIFQPLEENCIIPEQQLTKAERKGYTVVEWGGAELD